MASSVLRRVVAAVAVVSVVSGVLVAVQAREAAPAVASTVSAQVPAPVTVSSKPDLVSARLAAAAQGSRVEVTSLDTATSTTWVNPDGTMTTQMGAQPYQAETAPGQWQPLNDSLQSQSNGTVSPRVGITGLVFGAKGSAVAARLGAAADAATLHWQAPLPAPTVTGSAATYPNVYPGTSLTAQSKPTGFELSLLVHNAAAAAALPDSIALPLSGKGLTWSLGTDGVLLGKNVAGATVVSSAGASAWDATRGAHTGEPLHSAPLSLSLTGSVGSQVLHVATPRALLADPATVFPVTIDPSTTWSTTAWTFVDSGYPNTSYFNSSGPAKVGTFNSGGDKDRTLYRFKTTGLASKDVLSATFRVWENWSWSCNRRKVDVWGDGGSITSSTTWKNQPPVATKWATITAAKGYNSSCPAGTVRTSVTGWARRAAGNGKTYNLIELRSPNETDNTFWKKFATKAFVDVTYDSYPGTAVGKSVKPCSAKCLATVLTDSTTPRLTGRTTDPDGGSLRYDFQVWNSGGSSDIVNGSRSGIASGSTATWTVPSGKLGNGKTYKYRVRAYDGHVYGAWSSWLAFTVDTTAPAKPAVTSSVSDWNSGQPSATNSGTIDWSDTSGDVATYSWRLDGGTWSAPTTATSHSVSGLNDGAHTFSVRATDKAGNTSAIGSFGFQVNYGLSTPADQDRTQKDVTLAPAAPSNVSYVRYRWRQSTTGSWNDIPTSDVTTPGSSSHPVTGDWPWSAISDGSWVWNVAGTVPADGLVQVQACYSTDSSGSSPRCQATPVSIQLAKTSFGDSYATQGIGPGTLSLLTGDYSVSASDVNVTAYQASLSLGRSLTTLAPAVSKSGDATGVFGPGWTASLSGPQAGDAGMTATVGGDKSYVVLTGADGGQLLYQATGSLSGSTISYTGVGDANDGSTLTYNTAASPATLTLTDLAGTVTTWVPSSTQQTPPLWVPESVAESSTSATGVNTTTTMVYGTSGTTAGLPVRMIAPTPPGLFGSGSSTLCDASNAATTPGCRSLTFSYTQITTSTGTVTRLAGVSLDAYNPAKSGGAGMDTVPVEAYGYNAAGQLASAWDPRISPALKTTYTYDADDRLATLTPPGQAAWTLHYDGSGRLSSITRPDAALGKTATITVVYDVPLSGTGLPDLTGATAASWGQTSDLPAAGSATAIFPPDSPPASPPSSSDWQHAAVTYMDVNGRSVDTAGYSHGAWQIAATGYDQQGNTTWTLTAGNRAQALNPTSSTDPYVAAQPDSADRAALLCTVDDYSPDGLELTDEYGPMHPVQLADGSTIDARSHTHTSYDQNSPNGTTYDLPTTSVVSAQDSAGVDHDPVTSHTGYAPIETGDASGWLLRQPTSTTAQLGTAPSASDPVTITRYNDQGQVIEQRLPGDAAGGHAGSTLTSYYTATGTGDCVSPAQAGLPCTTGPAAQPASGKPLATTRYTYSHVRRRHDQDRDRRLDRPHQHHRLRHRRPAGQQQHHRQPHCGRRHRPTDRALRLRAGHRAAHHDQHHQRQHHHQPDHRIRQPRAHHQLHRRHRHHLDHQLRHRRPTGERLRRQSHQQLQLRPGHRPDDRRGRRY